MDEGCLNWKHYGDYDRAACIYGGNYAVYLLDINLGREKVEMDFVMKNVRHGDKNLTFLIVKLGRSSLDWMYNKFVVKMVLCCSSLLCKAKNKNGYNLVNS